MNKIESLSEFNIYTICNFSEKVGKTSLAFNLSYLIDNSLIVDTSFKGDLSSFYDPLYYQSEAPSLSQMLAPYFTDEIKSVKSIARKIGKTNTYFENHKAFFISSSENLHFFPMYMMEAIRENCAEKNAYRLFSLKNELLQEMRALNVNKCLIDTSAFLAGTTHLALHAADALIVPVKPDQRSISSLKLFLHTLSASTSPFIRLLPPESSAPKIQLIILTHCKKTKNITKESCYMQIKDIIARNINCFTTDDPENHIVLLNDFQDAGQISESSRKPIDLIKSNETKVGSSINIIKKQLRSISERIQ